MTKKIDTTTIGGRIKSARINKGLTQQELADQLYIPMTTLSTYENNKAELKGQVVVELANALGDDPNFATTVLNQLSQKADITYVDNLFNSIVNGEEVYY